MTKDEITRLIMRARLDQFTRPGEVFTAPARVRRLTDLLAALANELETLADIEE